MGSYIEAVGSHSGSSGRQGNRRGCLVCANIALVCMYVCMHVYRYVIDIYIYMCIYIYVYICESEYVRVYSFLSLNICI